MFFLSNIVEGRWRSCGGASPCVGCCGVAPWFVRNPLTTISTSPCVSSKTPTCWTHTGTFECTQLVFSNPHRHPHTHPKHTVPMPHHAHTPRTTKHTPHTHFKTHVLHIHINMPSHSTSQHTTHATHTQHNARTIQSSMSGLDSNVRIIFQLVIFLN